MSLNIHFFPFPFIFLFSFQNIILPGEDISLQDMDIFNGHLVLFVSKKGVPMLCSINLSINFECKVFKYILFRALTCTESSKSHVIACYIRDNFPILYASSKATQ